VDNRAIIWVLWKSVMHHALWLLEQPIVERLKYWVKNKLSWTKTFGRIAFPHIGFLFLQLEVHCTLHDGTGKFRISASCAA